jgi:hypothetical protein
MNIVVTAHLSCCGGHLTVGSSLEQPHFFVIGASLILFARVPVNTNGSSIQSCI